MNKKLLIIFMSLLPFSGIAQQGISIIPQPVSLTQNNGVFVIEEYTGIRFNKKDKSLKAAATFLSAYIKNISGYILPINPQKGRSIHLIIEKTDDIGDEGYKLDVTPASIRIVANTKEGIIYGMQSLFQTLPQIRNNAALEVPCMSVKDFPRFKWRGMHLDVSRHFFSPEIIKQYIDLMVSYKFNIFHWHLTDTQGWRLEIKKYPKLTSVGAWRVDRRGVPFREIQPPREDEPASYGGYYTQEQVKEIVAYARARNITIVPEIEMPGHSQAAIASYPFLSCIQQPQLVSPGRANSNMQSNYCAGNDSVFTFLENVLAETMELFPSQYIHIGGDEVKKTAWEQCPKCQGRMKAEGLKDEDELQSYFVSRIGKYLKENNRKLIGWDEILEGGLAPGATVMSWRGEKGGIQAAKMHHDVVMSPGNPLYFDKYQRGPEGEPPAIGGMNTLKKVYDYDPIPEQLTVEESKYILGAQANVWTEFISSVEQLEYMILPRMLAIAEVNWSPKESKNWKGFNDRLQYHFRAFDEKGLNYSPGNFAVAMKSLNKNGKLFVSLSSDIPDADIYYTTDGSLPTLKSEKYEQPVPVETSIVLKAITVVDGKVMVEEPAEESFTAK